SQVAWMSDETHPFVIVLIEVARIVPRFVVRLVVKLVFPFEHLGVGCASRAEVDELSALARRGGRAPPRPPARGGPPRPPGPRGPHAGAVARARGRADGRSRTRPAGLRDARPPAIMEDGTRCRTPSSTPTARRSTIRPSPTSLR